MNDFLLYILKSAFCLSLLYLAFRTVMRKEVFFALNRMALLAIVVFSFIVPLLYLPSTIKPIIQERIIPQVSFYESETEPTTAVEIGKTTVSVSSPVVDQKEKPLPYSTLQIIFFIYLAGMLFSFLVFINGIGSVLLMLRKAQRVKMEGFYLFILEKDIPAFSFWKMIFISRADYTKHGTTILAHEQQHIRLGHFYDLMLMELAKMAHWFNPVIYWLIQDLKAIHEYQADQYTLSKGIDARKYQLLIIEKGVGPQRLALANSFNHCQIKKRITMMNQSKNGKAGIWKVATFLPLLALLLMFCGRKSSNELPNFDRCEITNVSMCQRSKFIIELSVDKIVGSSDTAYFSKPKNLVYLIVTSKNMTELADGEYRFTSFPRYQLDSMTFTGIAYINKTENKISSGTLEINKSGDKVSISYQLYGKPAFSKEAITGSYVGAYSFEDRSLKTDDEEKYSLGELSNVSDSNQCLSIEANNEGNFINKQNCSLYGIVKKYYALKRINAENPITVNISNSSVNRIREIHEILALPNPIPYTNNTESSFQVVPPS